MNPVRVRLRALAKMLAQDVREENFSPVSKQQPVHEDVRTGCTYRMFEWRADLPLTKWDF